MLEVLVIVVLSVILLIGLGACKAAKQGDRVDEVLKAYSDKLKQQKKDEKSNV